MAGRSSSCMKWVDITNGHDRNHDHTLTTTDVSALSYTVLDKVDKPSWTILETYNNTSHSTAEIVISKSKQLT